MKQFNGHKCLLNRTLIERLPMASMDVGGIQRICWFREYNSKRILIAW